MPRSKKAAIEQIKKRVKESKSEEESQERLLSGEFKSNEPIELESLGAVLNLPDPKVYKVGKYEFSIVDLGFIYSRAYVKTIVPAIEKTVKASVPVISALSGSWVYLRNINYERVEVLRQGLLHPDVDLELVKSILKGLGVQLVTDDLIEDLKVKAGDQGAFFNRISQAFSEPLLNAVKSISFSDLIMSIVDALPDLVMASFEAYAYSKNMKINSNELKDFIMHNMDIFEMFEIVTAQIDRIRRGGKLISFFDQIKKMLGMENLLTAMPTV